MKDDFTETPLEPAVLTATEARMIATERKEHYEALRAAERREARRLLAREAI